MYSEDVLKLPKAIISKSESRHPVENNEQFSCAILFLVERFDKHDLTGYCATFAFSCYRN